MNAPNYEFHLHGSLNRNNSNYAQSMLSGEKCPDISYISTINFFNCGLPSSGGSMSRIMTALDALKCSSRYLTQNHGHSCGQTGGMRVRDRLRGNRTGDTEGVTAGRVLSTNASKTTHKCLHTDSTVCSREIVY
jgi:hypothetical protein